MPLVFRNVIEAIYPHRDNSAATKYSPETPVNTPGISSIILHLFETPFSANLK